jgi:DNA-binding XRE family transcriptional regulator
MKNHLSQKTVEAVIDALKEERKKQGISHETLAEAAGLHRSAISLIEAHKRQPTLLTCVKLATALKCDLGAMLSKVQKKL